MIRGCTSSFKYFRYCPFKALKQPSTVKRLMTGSAALNPGALCVFVHACSVLTAAASVG